MSLKRSSSKVHCALRVEDSSSTKISGTGKLKTWFISLPGNQRFLPRNALSVFFKLLNRVVVVQNNCI